MRIITAPIEFIFSPIFLATYRIVIIAVESTRLLSVAEALFLTDIFYPWSLLYKSYITI